MNLKNLVDIMIINSSECGQQFKSLIDEKFGKDSNKAIINLMQINYEFLFFFSHLVMRLSFQVLGSDKRNKLQDLLGPILMNSTTEAWFGHWSEKLKEGIKNDFSKNINFSEMEYSKYKILVPEQVENYNDTLFGEFCKNVARMSGYENDNAVIMKCMDIIIKKFTDMQLGNLIIEVGKKIR